MRLEKFKEKDNKRIGIVVFTIVCILLVSGVILYRTFAIFEVNNNFNVINGEVEDPGDIYFAFYKDEQIQKEMPKKEEGYVLDEKKSYCGVTGGNDSNIKVFVTEDNMIHVSGVATSRTKCNLYFVRGVYILGKGVPIVESGNGLYEVKHDDVTEINEGFKETEYRYAGNASNYVIFNNEEWRIIGLVNVMIDNEVEQRVKIIREHNIGRIAWDTSNLNDWAKSSLMKLLNEGEYYQKQGNYLDKGLVENSKHMIEEVTWTLSNNYNGTELNANLWYQIERNSSISWKGNIGLIYASDGIYAIHDGKYWLSYNTVVPTLNTFRTSYAGVVTINFGTNDVKVSGDGLNQSQYIFPTLYLKTNVKIQNDDKDGSSSSPYNLVQLLKY